MVFGKCEIFVGGPQLIFNQVNLGAVASVKCLFPLFYQYSLQYINIQWCSCAYKCKTDFCHSSNVGGHGFTKAEDFCQSKFKIRSGTGKILRVGFR